LKDLGVTVPEIMPVHDLWPLDGATMGLIFCSDPTLRQDDFRLVDAHGSAWASSWTWFTIMPDRRGIT
jgi:hypothetical protein